MSKENFPKPNLTVDIIALSTDSRPEILLIRRKNDPYKGCWALPGGYVEENETTGKAAIRELKEETNLDTPGVVLECVVSTPGRDPRGWTISLVYIAPITDKSKAKTTDHKECDATEVQWFPFERLPEMAFDHKDIIKSYVIKWHGVTQTNSYNSELGNK